MSISHIAATIWAAGFVMYLLAVLDDMRYSGFFTRTLLFVGTIAMAGAYIVMGAFYLVPFAAVGLWLGLSAYNERHPVPLEDEE